MTDFTPPDGFSDAEFSPGFLDHGGPYFLKERSNGPALVALRIERHHMNYGGNAHGGVIATLADVALSYAVYDAERPKLTPVTVNLNVNYLNGARIGDWLVAEVTLDRLGGRLAYTSGAISCGDEMLARIAGVFAIKR